MSDNQNIVYEFASYLEKTSGIPAYIDKIDPGANDLPMWNIEIDQKWTISSMQTQIVSFILV